MHIIHGEGPVKQGKQNIDALEKEHAGAAPMVERRNVLKSGLATTFVFAGSTVLSVLSCMRRVFSSSDDISGGS
jgi:hypothetical protein